MKKNIRTILFIIFACYGIHLIAASAEVKIINDSGQDILIYLYLTKGTTQTIAIKDQKSFKVTAEKRNIEKIDVKIKEPNKTMTIEKDKLEKYSTFTVGKICTMQFPPKCNTNISATK